MHGQGEPFLGMILKLSPEVPREEQESAVRRQWRLVQAGGTGQSPRGRGCSIGPVWNLLVDLEQASKARREWFEVLLIRFYWGPCLAKQLLRVPAPLPSALCPLHVHTCQPGLLLPAPRRGRSLASGAHLSQACSWPEVPGVAPFPQRLAPYRKDSSRCLLYLPEPLRRTCLVLDLASAACPSLSRSHFATCL